MIIQKVKEFLNSHDIKYITIDYSPTYTKQEILEYKSKLGMELIEAVFVEIENKQLAMVIVPASLTINLGSLQQALGSTNVRLLNQQEVENLFPGYELGTIPPLGSIYQMDTFLAPDLLHNQEIAFYAGSYSHLLRMGFNDFEKLVKPEREITFLTRSKYRALVSNVVPEAERPNLKKHEHCFLGVSLENKNFSIPKLIAIVDWIAKHFSRCTVFIADSMHRFTLQINRDFNEIQAYDKALLLGREYVDRSRIVFERHADTCHFDVMLASEIGKSEDYFNYLEQLQNQFSKDEKFSNSVKSCAQEFILRHLEQHTEHFDRCAEMSYAYLLEELAITACLVKYGLSIMIYPGSLATIFGDIANGNHPDVPECLQKIIHVSLHLRKR